MTIMTADQATEKQLKFIEDLLVQKAVPEAIKMQYLENKETMTKKIASSFITIFLGLPNAEIKADAPADNLNEKQKLYLELKQEIEAMPTAKYAIPAGEVMMDLLEKPIANDMVFVEIRKYQGKTYIKQLHGAPGSFMRSMMPMADALVFARIIQRDPYNYTKLFADHYQCCGRCGAELTDEVSRQLRLGPDCRKAFGV